MKQLFGILALVICFASVAHAADAPPASSEPSDSSGASAQPHHFSLMFEPVGYGPSATISRGVAAGWYMTENNLLSLEYTVGWGLNFDDLNSSHIDTSSIAVTFRHFLNRSFYLKGGLMYRTMNYSDNGYDVDVGQDVSRNLQGNSVAIEAAIGNRWNIHHFSIGVDWIGYVQPLSTTTTSSFDAPGSARDQYLTGGTLEICRFSLGVVF